MALLSIACRLRHAALACVLAIAGSNVAGVVAAEIDYARDVRPLFKARCVSCHGALRQEGGLRLDTGALARTGGDSGPGLVPGDPDESLLIARISAADESERMPAEGEPLSAVQVALLRDWVRAGARSPADEVPPDDPRHHWAFQPLRVADELGSAPASASTIDAILRQRLQAAGIEPAPTADRLTLVRRLYLDLHGLPPTPDKVAAFLADESPDAWNKLVERVLASPRYGEHWAQHWLDVVRYADTHGYEVNTPRDHAWPYRDYVIAAFNDDLPYDRFVCEQLAGDALGADAATGFLVAAAVLLPGQIGADDVSKRLARQDALDDIIVGTSATFLGLSIGCARCHDHKFDPISQRDYYAMQAFFAGVEYNDRAIDDAAGRRRRAQAAKLAPRLAALRTEMRAFAPVAAVFRPAQVDVATLDRLAELCAPDAAAKLHASVDGLKRLLAQEAELKKPTLYFAGTFRTPDETHVLNRGDPEQPGQRVGPRVPTALGTLELSSDCQEQPRRLALARWIASPDNPLTARVLVNRVWQYHFGNGLVETASDFGLSGDRPSHPHLLDWLARQFVAGGWSVKSLHRLILSTEAFRRSSRSDPAAQTLDADNRLLWRFAARRLEGEAIRDSMLAISGRLNLQMGGPGYNFFQTRGGLSGFPPLDRFGPAELRRMIYSHKIRMEPVPVFGAFDCPDAGQATPKRSQSTTAIQALHLFNSPFVAEQAEAFAARVTREVGSAPADQIERACLLAFGRQPDDVEASACRQVVDEHGLATLCRVLFNSNEFLFLP